LAVFGLALVTAFALLTVAHPLLMSTIWHNDVRVYDPVTGYDAPTIEAVVVDQVTDPSTQIHLVDARITVDIAAKVGDVVEKRLQPAPPSGTHYLGTDPFGRDVFSMLLAGAWPTFVVGVVAGITTALVGTALATIAAVMRGPVDRVVTGVADILLLFPAPLAMIVVAGLVELTPARFGIFYGLIAGGSTALIVLRSHALAIMQQAFIDAARVSGAGRARLGRHHLLPHLIPLSAVTMVTAVVGAVVAHGFASWLSYSDDLLNWGAMMFIAIGFYELQGVVAWHVLLAGAAAISLFCAGFYLISLGLRDVAFPPQNSNRVTRPRSRGSGAPATERPERT
jgi:peptide/nickel transport system permease protein